MHLGYAAALEMTLITQPHKKVISHINCETCVIINLSRQNKNFIQQSSEGVSTKASPPLMKVTAYSGFSVSIRQMKDPKQQ